MPSFSQMIQLWTAVTLKWRLMQRFISLNFQRGCTWWVESSVKMTDTFGFLQTVIWWGGLKGVKKNYLLVDKEWKQASGDDRYRQDERAKWTARKTGNKFTYWKPSCFPGGTSSCSVQSHLLLLSVGLTSAFSHDHTSLEHHHHWITEEKLTYPSIPVTGPQVWKHHCSIRVISNPLNRSQSAPPRASVSPMKLGTIQPKTSASPSSQTQLLSLNRLGQVK